MDERVSEEFVNAVERWKRMRARFEQRQILKREYELFVKFEEESYSIWGLYQQTTIGNVNVPKLDYRDPVELSWMWGWIKGNRKWHSWNKCKGLSREESSKLFIAAVNDLEHRLPELIEEWKDDQDPRIPDQKAWVPEEDLEHWERVTKEEKIKRRERSAAQRKHEESLGMWDDENDQ